MKPKKGMTRSMRRSLKMRRTSFPVKDCIVTLHGSEDRYFVTVNKFSYKPVYLSKLSALELHKQLTKKYWGKFIVKMKINNITRILMKE